MFYPWMTRKQLKRLMRKGNIVAKAEWEFRYEGTPREPQANNLWCVAPVHTEEPCTTT